MVSGDFLYQHHDGSSLIVDFPPVPRRQIGESRRHHAVSTTDDSSTIEVTQQPMMKRSKKVKSVSFSATSTMVLMPPKSKQELASAWYSGEEKWKTVLVGSVRDSLLASLLMCRSTSIQVNFRLVYFLFCEILSQNSSLNFPPFWCAYALIFPSFQTVSFHLPKIP